MMVTAGLLAFAFSVFADYGGTKTSFEQHPVGASGSNLIFRDDESGDGSSHWYSQDPASDNSSVQSYTEQDLAKYSYNTTDNKRLTPFPAANGSDDTSNNPGGQYLDVDASAKPLYRTLNQQSGEWPQGVTIGDGLVVDTLVQFTASEDEAVPDLSSESAKMAVWLFARDHSEATAEQEEIVGKTNLVVTAGSLVNDAPVATNFVVEAAGVTVEPNTWHRVTLRAIQDIGDGSRHRGDGVAGFALFIDGKAVSCVDADYDDKIGTANLTGYLKGDPAKLLENKQLFASALPVSNQESTKLTGVGFKGTGKIDDVAVVELGDGPVFVQPDHTFTLKWETGVVSFKIDGVTYTVADLPSGQDSVVLTLSGSTTQVTVSDVVLSSVDLKLAVRKDGETVAGNEGSYVCECTSADTVAQLVVQKDNFTVNGVGCTTLQDAFDYIRTEGLASATILLSSDVEVSVDAQWTQAVGVLDANANVIFDLNGNVLSVAENDNNDIDLFYANKGTLTIIDSKGNGKIVSPYNPLLGTGENGEIYVGQDAAADYGATIDSVVSLSDANVYVCKGFFKDVDYTDYIGSPSFKDYYAMAKTEGAQISETTKGGVKYWSVTRAVIGQSSYNITYMDGDTVMTGISPNSYVYGVGCTLPTDIVKEHYTFAGWYDKPQGTQGAAKWEFIGNDETDDKVFYAYFDAVPQYAFTVAEIENTTVSYTYGDATGGAGDVQVYDGESIRVTYTPATGYGVTDGVLTKVYTIDGAAATSAGQVTVALATYTITYCDYYDDEEHVLEGLTPTSYQYTDEAVTLPTTATKEGYTFKGWYLDTDYSGSAVTEIAANETGDRVFYAKFEKNGEPGGTGWPAEGASSSPEVDTTAAFGLVTAGGDTVFTMTISNASAGYRYRLVGYAALPTTGAPTVTGEWIVPTGDSVTVTADKVTDASGFYKIEAEVAP